MRQHFSSKAGVSGLWRALVLIRPSVVVVSVIGFVGSIITMSIYASSSALSEPVRPSIVCLGDSLTAGYQYGVSGPTFHPYSHALEAELAKEVQAVSLGYSGWRTHDLIAHAREYSRLPYSDKDAPLRPGLISALRLYRPRLVVIMAGTNDIRKAKTARELQPDALMERIWRLHRMAHRHKVPSIVISIPPWGPRSSTSAQSPLDPDLVEKARSQCNALLKKKVDAHPEVAKFWDFPFSFNDTSPYFNEDELHFTRAGSDRLGKSLAEFVIKWYPYLASS